MKTFTFGKRAMAVARKVNKLVDQLNYSDAFFLLDETYKLWQQHDNIKLLEEGAADIMVVIEIRRAI